MHAMYHERIHPVTVSFPSHSIAPNGGPSYTHVYYFYVGLVHVAGAAEYSWARQLHFLEGSVVKDSLHF